MQKVIFSFLLLFMSFVAFSQIKEAEKLHSEGVKLFNKTDYTNAFKTFTKEISIRKKENDPKNESLASIYAASSLQKQNKHSKAIKYLTSSLEIGIKLNNYNIIGTCYGMLSESYAASGNDLKAQEYYTNYKNFESHVENKELKSTLEQTKEAKITLEQELVKTTDSLQKTEENLAVTKAIAETRKMKLSITEKQKEIQKIELDKQKLTIKQSQLEIQNQRIIRNFIIIVLIFLLVLLGLMIYSYRQKKKDNRIIHAQKERIQESINYALKIQKAMLPKEEYIAESLSNFFILYQPVSVVSGDFYFYLKDEHENTAYLAAVDCTGHGVPGAMMSMIAYNSLSEIIHNGETEVHEILNKLHFKIIKALNQQSTSNRDGVDIALCKLFYNESKIEYSGARNPLVYIQNNKLTIVKANRRPVGGIYKKELESFTKETVLITESTQFYIFSDGYSDQFDEKGTNKISSKRMYDYFNEIHTLSFNEQKEILHQKYTAWKGNYEQIDDVCIIGFKMG